MEFVDPARSFSSNSTDVTSNEVTKKLIYLIRAPIAFPLVIAAFFVLYWCRRLSAPANGSKQGETVKRAKLGDEYRSSSSKVVKDQLEGTWHLSSYQLELNTPIRITSQPFGMNPQGSLIYTKDGYMSMNIMHPGCAPFKATNPHGGTQQENSSAASHYMAYSGRYETFEYQGQKLVNHILDTSLYPNWLDADQPRLCEIEGNELVLRPIWMPTFLGMKVGGVLRWKRAEPEQN